MIRQTHIRINDLEEKISQIPKRGATSREKEYRWLLEKTLESNYDMLKVLTGEPDYPELIQ